MVSQSTVSIFFLRVVPHVVDDPAGADAVEDSRSVCGAGGGKFSTLKVRVEHIAGGAVLVGRTAGVDSSVAPRPAELAPLLAEWPPLTPSMNIITKQHIYKENAYYKVHTYARKKY